MTGLREALEESYDAIDSETEEAPAEAVADAPAEAEEPTAEAHSDEGDAEQDQRDRDEQGRFAPRQKPVAQAKAVGAPSSSPGAQAAGEAPLPVTSAAASVFKAPSSWKPGVREKWAGLPSEVQAEVVRREREVAQVLQQSAEERKAAQGFQETVRPYEAQIRAAGVDPQKYVGDLLQKAHALSYGQPHQKADMLADIIMQFGVPPQDLDQALVARLSGGRGQQGQGAQFKDPRVDQLLQRLESQEHERTTAAARDADTTAGSFADSHEFFNDVGEHVADILDVWAKQGKTKISDADLEHAYNLACQMHPDVSPILSQRQAQKSVRTVQAATQRARTAASSVRSQPTAAVAAQPTGRRAALESAYDELDQ